MVEEFNFNQKINTINVEDLKNVLNERIGVETIPNLLYAISQIGPSFNEAINSDNKDRVVELYEKIRMHDNYLSEKYRSTPEERRYTEAVEQAMEVLRNKIKTFKKVD
jgi:methionyl-tRNA synthetase